MRSKLFVPGSRPELFDKALRGDADALSFDLEDSVSASRKADARRAVQDLLTRPEARAPGKTLIRPVVRPGRALLTLPKVEATDDVLAAVHAVEAAERDHGVTEPVGLLLNIETARGARPPPAPAPPRGGPGSRQPGVPMASRSRWACCSTSRRRAGCASRTRWPRRIRAWPA